jgi:hypothetical protein
LSKKFCGRTTPGYRRSTSTAGCTQRAGSGCRAPPSGPDKSSACLTDNRQEGTTSITVKQTTERDRPPRLPVFWRTRGLSSFNGGSDDAICVVGRIAEERRCRMVVLRLRSLCRRLKLSVLARERWELLQWEKPPLTDLAPLGLGLQEGAPQRAEALRSAASRVPSRLRVVAAHH